MLRRSADRKVWSANSVFCSRVQKIIYMLLTKDRLSAEINRKLAITNPRKNMYDGADQSGSLNADRLFADPEALISEWARGPEGDLLPLSEAARLASLDRLGGVFLVGFGARLKTAIVAGRSEDIGEDLNLISLHPQVAAFAGYGGLVATWLTMPEPLRAPVERFLTETLTPILATKCPMASPFAISVPVEFGGKARRKPSMFA